MTAPAFAEERPALDGLASEDCARLLDVVTELSRLRELDGVTRTVLAAARALTDADGITLALREGTFAHYADEDAIAPLWKGRRFPLGECPSGWAMEHRQNVVLEDVRTGPRAPSALFAATFVKSAAIVPVRPADPLGALGAYWARPHRATPREIALLEALANAASIALENGTLYRAALEAARVREDFLSIASHELRTPLTSLLLQLESLERKAGTLPPEQVAPRLASATKSAHRMRELVDRLLDVTRVMSGNLEIRREAVDLAPVLRALVDRVQAGRDERDAPIALSVPSSVVVRCDVARIDMVVTNLLTNAVKYGEGKPIAIGAEVDEAKVRVWVEDHGIGIAPDDQARIFERFERACAVKNYGGFGVGLWLAKRIVEAHGGALDVRSSLGQGARFTVEIPR